MATVALPALIALVSGCGGGSATVDAKASPSVPGTSGIAQWNAATQVPDSWTLQTADAEAMRSNDNAQTLSVDVTLRPVRLSDASCAGEAGGWIEDEGNPDVVWVFLRTAVPDVARDDALLRPVRRYGECASVPTTVKLGATSPLSGRDVMADGVRWVDDGDGTFRRCELPSCDPRTGEAPTVASCDDRAALVDDVRTLGDTGMHAGIGEIRCEGGFAMVEADIGAGACPPADGGANPCAGERVDRLFLRAGSPHWSVIFRSREPGCGGVLALAPDYPVALCEDLPALPR